MMMSGELSSRHNHIHTETQLETFVHQAGPGQANIATRFTQITRPDQGRPVFQQCYNNIHKHRAAHQAGPGQADPRPPPFKPSRKGCGILALLYERQLASQQPVACVQVRQPVGQSQSVGRSVSRSSRFSSASQPTPPTTRPKPRPGEDTQGLCKSGSQTVSQPVSRSHQFSQSSSPLGQSHTPAAAQRSYARGPKLRASARCMQAFEILCTSYLCVCGCRAWRAPAWRPAGPGCPP